MNDNSLQNILDTRLIVGFLGEKQQAAWWSSSFLSTTSKAFLSPIFPNTIQVAQYSGVCQAATIIHDEHIGIGGTFHLFRLPDPIERALLKCIQNQNDEDSATKYIGSHDIALDLLKNLGIESIAKSEGPYAVGDYTDDQVIKLIQICRSYYYHAFQEGYKVFPYMRYK
jgi:hypothetical protein